MRPAHTSLISITLKRNGDPYNLVLRFHCSHAHADGVVRCKEGLNASSTQFVF